MCIYCCVSGTAEQYVCIPDVPLYNSSNTVQQTQYNRCTLLRTTIPLLLYLLYAHTEAPAQPDAFDRSSMSAGPRGGRAPVSPCVYPYPRTHGEIRAEFPLSVPIPTYLRRDPGRNGPGGAPAIPTPIGSDKKMINIADNITHTSSTTTKQHQVHRLFCGVHTSLARRRSPAAGLVGCTQHTKY